MLAVWISGIAVAFLVSGITGYILSYYLKRLGILDHPNSRSLHFSPVPRGGGIAILLGVVVASLIVIRGNLLLDLLPMVLLGLAFVLVCAISLLDDVRRSNAVIRFLIHITAAMLVVAAGFSLHALDVVVISIHLSFVVGSIVTVLFVVWMINLYNFMDGMDGFAAGMGVFGFGAYALLGALMGANTFAQLNAIIATACFGFLLLNFPPARLFMGDVGSATLGFLAAIMTLWADKHRVFPLWLGVLVFSPFVVDASWTLLRRVLEGSKPWEAHQAHFYQRLVRAGWGHRRTVLWEYGLMLVSGAIAVGLQLISSQAAQMTGVGVVFLGYVILGLWINGLEMRRKAT